MGNNISFRKNENYSSKLNLVFLVSINMHSKIKDDPICLLLTDFSEIESISKTKKFFRFLHYNKDKVHQILYNEDTNIQIDDDFKENHLAGNFYLCSLIEDNYEIINYNYTFTYIKALNEQKKDENNKYYNLIISKEILELIKNYKDSEIEDESIEDELSQIEKQNIDYITNNINILNEIGLDLNVNSFIEMKIGELYTKIIISLIKNDKLTDFAISNNIYEQLNLQYIDIPFEENNSLENILEVLNSKNPYIQKYIIINFDDIYNQKKIMFFYILLKYIFKCPLYVYNIPLLLDTRKAIIPFLKSEKFKKFISKIKENEDDAKIEFVVKKLGDLDYELAITINERSTFLYSNLDMDKNSQSQYLKENNNERILDEVNNENINNNFENYNLRKIYFFSPNNEGKIVIDKENQKYIENGIVVKDKLAKSNGNNILEKENYKLKNCYQDVYIYLNNYYSCLKQTQLKSSYDFNLIIYFQEQNNQVVAHFICSDSRSGKNDVRESDILVNKSNELIGFQKIINHICTEYENVNTNIINPNLNITSDKSLSQDTIKINNINNISNIESKNNFLLDNEDKNKNKNEEQNKRQELINEIIPKDYLDFKLSEFKRIIYKHKESMKFFLHLKDGYYLSCGNDSDIVLYDENLNVIKTIPNLEDILYYITEKDSNNNKYIELIACCLKNIYLISINKQNDYNHTAKKYQIPKCTTLFCYNIGDNYIISGNGLTVNILKLFDDNLDEKKMMRYSNTTHKTGIQIDNENIAMISNSLLPGGENKISIFNIYSNELTHEITDNISPTLSENCACIMKLKDGAQYLLVGNKKITNNEKNGISITNLDLNREELKTNFYDTKNFQVYCLCQIILNQKNGSKSKYIRTNFFFAGGFEPEKKIGMVILYQLSDEKNLHIKFIQVLETEEENNEYEESMNKSMNNSYSKDEIINKSMDSNNIVRTGEINQSIEYPEKNCKSNNSSKLILNDSREDNNSSQMSDNNSSENNNSISKEFYKKAPDKNRNNEVCKIGLDKDKFYGFKMPVNTITQNDNTGEIIITTIDGGVYLFSEPNLSFYMNKDE